MTLTAVSTRRPSFSRCERTDSFVLSSPSDDLLEVLEHVPDPLGGVGQVVEVDLELLAHVALLGALERAEDGALRPDDRAEVDDLLLRVADVADDLLGAAHEDVLLEVAELAPERAEHREAGIDASVEDLVQEAAGARGS